MNEPLINLDSLPSHDIPSIRRLHLWSMRHATSDLSGAFHSTFRGTGLEFRDLREYIPGDEIKHIHWRASARSGKVYVKTYDEERSLRIHIALDCSASTFFQNRFRTYQKTAVILAKLAERSGDKVSLSLFAGDTLDFIAPVKGRSQSKKIISRLCDIRSLHSKTDMSKHCCFLRENLKHKSIVIILSDFVCSDFKYELRRLSLKHMVVLSTSIQPPTLPNVGLVNFFDPEDNSTVTIDTDSENYTDQINLIHSNLVTGLKDCIASVKGRFLGIGPSIIQSIIQFSRTKGR